MDALQMALAAAFLLGVISTVLVNAIIRNIAEIRANIAAERAANEDPSWKSIMWVEKDR